MADTTYLTGFKNAPLTIILDSTFRNKNDYPNVEEFSYGPSITSKWITYKGNQTDIKNYYLRLISITLPFRANLLSERYLLVALSHTNHSRMHGKLLNGSSSPGYNKSNFIVTLEKNINNAWLVFKPVTSPIPTSVIVGVAGEFHFALHDSVGNPFVINTIEDPTLAANQISIILELIPM